MMPTFRMLDCLIGGAIVGRTLVSRGSSSPVRRLLFSLPWYEGPPCIRTGFEGSSSGSGSITRLIAGLAGLVGG